MSREMKDSGIPWIGEIPKEWEVCRLKNLFRLKTGTTPNGYDVSGDGDKICWFTPSDISEDCNELYDSERKLLKDAVGRIELFPKGSLMFVGIGTVGKLGYTNIEGYSNQQITALIPKNVNSKYYFYYLIVDKQRIKDNAFFTILPIINNGYLSQNKVLCPPTDVQSKIASFLDRKCAEVDEMIALQEQIIEELKAYKQSVITEAVTKGLNPAAPMKDSGIEWIGSIPEHWEVSKVSRYFQIQLGKMLQPNQESETDTLCNYLCAANVGKNVLKLEPLKQMWISEKEKEQFSVKKGDLLVVEGGDVASCDVITDEVSDLYFQNALHRVRAKSNQDVRYLKYLLMIAKHNGHIDLICNKATISHFTKEKFATLNYLLPTVEEQNDIVSYLDTQCTEIDNLISIKLSKIDRLREYKKSIIYEYVTGKMEVK